ncbi:hypothetical protein CDAR_57791 [Caerostris darwini]|uniref:Metalloendopeptidase n=1 Tax=Caerostris darwini TaxID=1538125 RepID=A0AAV4PAB9_9ARAC|nr:astacin-like metalloprotease toxin 1 [Caerostris darwini]GIX93110.1 hypothetical protein CDAR_57791 [Caerostris darwini]
MLFSIIISVITFLVKLFLRYRAPPILEGPVLDAQQRRIAHEAFYGNGNEMLIYPGHAGVKDTNYRWPGYPGSATIPYVIPQSLEKHRGLIQEAMQHIQDNTCITFVERTNEKHYVQMKKGKGCYSVVGCGYQGSQPLSLGTGCENKGTIVHELLHTCGFFHEQMRSDRDNFIIVHEQNIIPEMLDQYNKTHPDDEQISTPYNTASIMHYGNYAFSKDPGNLKSMEAHDGTPLLEPLTSLA